MKKFNLDPMSLDKDTIAMLNDKQLKEIVGGVAVKGGNVCPAGATTSGSGSSICPAGGSSCVCES